MSAKDYSQSKQQLVLTIPCNDEACFANFCWTGNELLRQQIMSLIPMLADSRQSPSQLFQDQGQVIYLWGESGFGKSHLLQAICHDLGQSAAYLPLQLLKDWDPGILDGMDDCVLVAVDDVEEVVGHSAWEEALFHLYNRLSTQQHMLIVTGKVPPSATAIRLADLRSRLTSALILQMHELSDEDKVRTLQNHAKKRGLDLPKMVGQYILSRCARNMHDLHSILDRLDHASLVTQRKLTIPFVKDILAV